ncbi:nuclear envelope phosphatase-regulatory subunit 1 isoform X1 [Ammospiza nelsoni]|uniref:nuclear envelope phosphatase-regulatory subunit 1 isoform X1 n=1 Tax=Oenanthe melanoleuca TaxID=2939378 RepID=UPI0006B70657|nr:nuclear envelope phosphatase-regulatory subunit 1 isoform X1 [Oenanthe melanoleuca]XP_058669457.1 nuclear envelope phosphatase-regulatory subunit 1 isoform X1 [Ammospiza caudacuta]XP_059337612.1 nuclear envelope phosphatase-regulatory subunit 1 isoform X1 [Ammospiza nelsoni]
MNSLDQAEGECGRSERARSCFFGAPGAAGSAPGLPERAAPSLRSGTKRPREASAPSAPRSRRSSSAQTDLKAFERRLTEYIACLQPATGRWRMILIVVSVCTATGAWNWLIDPETQKVSFFTSLWNHPFFTISCITLIGLFFAGIHKRVVAPSIIAARCRTVLAEYNMSCDDTGKLILKPRPHVQ